MTKELFNLLNSPFFVGFDRIHDRMHEFNDSLSKNVSWKHPSYPPYNIRRPTSDEYVIEMAVAGFSEEDIDIQVEEDVLKISGSVSGDPTSKYLHKGIANREFTRNFNLAETIEVKNASLNNGCYKYSLKTLYPNTKSLGRLLSTKSKIRRNLNN
jgi:molecular chaperone IbpA